MVRIDVVYAMQSLETDCAIWHISRPVYVMPTSKAWSLL